MAPTKASAYAHRQAASVPAPVEDDSDSDFRAGSIPPEEQPAKKKRKSSASAKGEAKKKTKRKPSSRRRSARDSSEDEDEEEEEPPVKRRRVARKKFHGPNPLLAFFKDSDASDDEVAPKRATHYEAEEEDSDEEEKDDGPATKNNMFARYVKNRKSTTPEESETESDEDDGPPWKPSAAAPGDEESVTESDSEPEPAATLTVPTDDGSETESDGEYDGPAPMDQEPRPDFPIPPGQKPLGALVLDEAQGIKVPGAINTYLRPYQREGIEFFWTRFNEGRGGLLGDDMGLGKTIQVIAFLSAIMKKTGLKTDRKRRRRHVLALQDGAEWKRTKKLPPANATWQTALIIAPTSVVYNWEREFQTWGYFEVGCYMGAGRKEVLKQFKMGKLDVVITSHGLARRDIELLDDLPWSCIVLDEAHNVKNEKARTTKAYSQFECVRRFGLTGTAIQNSYDEFHTILDWTNPGKLGTQKHWKDCVSTPLKNGQSTTATERERYRSMKVAEVLKEKLLPLYFLRREKSKVIADQMPKKTDKVVFCPLTKQQLQVYRLFLGHEEIQNVLRRKEQCDCGSRNIRSKCCHKFDPGAIFRFLALLIKLSNHLGLILPAPTDSPEQLIRNREAAAVAFPSGNAPSYGLAIIDAKYCGKWKVLTSLLKEWKADVAAKNKVLIFTKSVKLLAMMSHQLKYESINFLQLDGSIKGEDRMKLIDDFHDETQDYFVFLISTMAGGTGLNLTGANKVVIFDPNWNPAHDLQAMDRAFRMGQRRDVEVFRLLGAGAVEELIYARQLYKQQQMQIGYSASIQTRYFEGVQGDPQRQGELFGLDNIFKLQENADSTKRVIEEAHIAQLDWKLKNAEAPTRHRKSRRDADLNLVGMESQSGEGDDLAGLGALLFSDALPSSNRSKSAESKKAMAGMYTHENPDLLRENVVAQEQAEDLKRRMRQSKKKSSTGAASRASPRDSSPEAQWPPVRVHKKNKTKKAPVKPIKERLAALIGIGAIQMPSELGKFAEEFIKFDAKQQAYTIERCDEWDEKQLRGDLEEEVPVEVEPEPEDMDM